MIEQATSIYRNARTAPRPTTGRQAIQAIYEKIVDAGTKFAIENPSRQPDGSWLRIIDRPEVPQS